MQKTYYYNFDHTNTHPGLFEGQPIYGKLSAQVDMYQFDNLPVFVHVQFNGSIVNSGPMRYNEMMKKGYYLEQIEISASLSDPDFIQYQSSPSSTMEMASISSSINLGINLSAGTFGPTPTTGAGAGFNISRTFTTSIPAYRVEDVSNSRAMIHKYILSVVDGAKYTEPLDLSQHDFAGFWTHLFGDPSFHELPAMARGANFPIISQALFYKETRGRQLPIPDTKLNMVLAVIPRYAEEIRFTNVEVKGGYSPLVIVSVDIPLSELWKK